MELAGTLFRCNPSSSDYMETTIWKFSHSTFFFVPLRISILDQWVYILYVNIVYFLPSFFSSLPSSFLPFLPSFLLSFLSFFLSSFPLKVFSPLGRKKKKNTSNRNICWTVISLWSWQGASTHYLQFPNRISRKDDLYFHRLSSHLNLLQSRILYPGKNHYTPHCLVPINTCWALVLNSKILSLFCLSLENWLQNF